MKILYLTVEAPLDPAAVATGNQVRAQGLTEALEQAGHAVIGVRPHDAESTEPPTTSVYRTRDELAALINKHEPGAIVVGYWSLLPHLPSTSAPVILDYTAPRILELMFQESREIAERTAELIAALRRADHFLVGNQRQADLLLSQLLQAGFDCRTHVPISIVPISARHLSEQSSRSATSVTVANAGVDWPWRNAQAYRHIIESVAQKNSALFFREFTGNYPGKLPDSENTLLSYGNLKGALKECDIGLELGEQNTEREFSHSFRSIEYLECGLPIIINSWIPLSSDIAKFNAGWVIDSPTELEKVLNEVLADPSALDGKREGVTKLVSTTLNYRCTSKPLLEYLENPQRPNRIAVQTTGVTSSEAPALKEFQEQPSSAKTSTLKVFLGAVFKSLFFKRRPESTPDILMVTRSDLFPADHGAAVKIIRTAEALSRQGRDVWLTTDNRREYYQFLDGQMITHRFPLPVRFFCLPRVLAFARLLLKGYPVSNHFLYLPVTDTSYIVRTVWLAGKKPVGAYQAEFPAYVRPCRFARSLFGGKVLLVQHNVEYERIKNQVRDLTEKNYSTLKNLEVAMCHLADNIVAVSDNDRNKMIEDGIPAEKIHTIPHGVDLHAFRSTEPLNIHARYGLPAGDKVLVYHGTYSYPPNLESMEVIAREILPRLQDRGLKISVLAIGSKPPDFPLHAKIHFVGSVDNLAEVIPSADLAVVPLQDGGGTRMKILDYFAAGVPVISTEKGIEGIPVTNGREAIIEDDMNSICDAIESLLQNNEKAEEIRQAANKFVNELGWDAVIRRYLPLLQ